MTTDLKEFAQLVKERVRLSDVVGAHVELRQRGRDRLGLCPFHSEKTPSFHVKDEEGFYYCFGCRATGDAIKFLREVEGLDFVEAVRKLAGLAGVEMPALRAQSPEDRAHRQREEDDRDALRRLHREALAFFRKSFAASPAARAYADKRGLRADALDRFEIGYAPEGWQHLTEHLAGRGATDRLLELGGLASRSSKPDARRRIYDKFRHRLIFPIWDTAGKPIAFGGRAIGPDDEPKYLNSPETPIYNKSATLYGLHHARPAMREAGGALLLEGYMDVVALWQAGFANGVASCGTALTRDQARQLRRLTDRVLFLYDGDDAGQKAMLRGCLELLPEGLQVMVVSLPAEHDPDSFIAAEGADAMAARIGEAEEAFDYFLAAEARRHGIANVSGRMRVSEALLPLVAAVRHAVAREGYLARLADVVQTRPADLQRQMRQVAPRRADDFDIAEDAHAESAPLDITNGATPPSESHDAAESSSAFEEAFIDIAERTVLRLALEHPSLRERLRAELTIEWIGSEALRALIDRVLASELPARAWSDGETLEPPLREDERLFVRATLAWRDDDFATSPPDSTLSFNLRRLRKSHCERQRRADYSIMRSRPAAPISEPDPLALEPVSVLDRSARDYYAAAGVYYGGPRRKRDERAGPTTDAAA